MPVFFNGREWITPATASVVDDSAMYNPNLSVGNVLAVIGPSTGGQPLEPLTFGNPQDAATALGSGDLVDAIVRAFNPSPQVTGPSKVVAVRVNPATPSVGVVKDATGNPVINLSSTDYGLRTAQTRWKIEAGSTSGFRVTTALGNNYYSGDNIGLSPLSVAYTGAGATPTISVTDTTVTLAAGGTSTPIDLTANPTVQALVDQINAVPDFVAAVVGPNSNAAALNGLDAQTNAVLSAAPLLLTANLQAVITWFNSAADPLMTAARVDGAGTVPALSPFQFLTGGSDGITTTQQWQAAFTALQKADVQWVLSASGDPAVHAMADAHCQFMSNVARMERRSFSGMPLGSTDAQALAETLQLNSDRSSLLHIGCYDYDVNGKLTLYPAYITAAFVAGGFAGLNPGQTMTNKVISVRGLERLLQNPTDTDPLIQGGVLCVESTKKGYKVVKAITTWQENSNFNRVEVSVGAVMDFVSRNVRDILDDLRGDGGTPQLLADAVSRTDSTLALLSKAAPAGPGCLVGDAQNPPFKNITASLNGDVVAVQFQCSPVIPANYILVTIYAVPYSGTASA